MSTFRHSCCGTSAMYSKLKLGIHSWNSHLWLYCNSVCYGVLHALFSVARTFSFCFNAFPSVVGETTAMIRRSWAFLMPWLRMEWGLLDTSISTWTVCVVLSATQPLFIKVPCYMHFLFLLLADCWADHRDDQGNIVPDPSRFPKWEYKHVGSPHVHRVCL